MEELEIKEKKVAIYIRTAQKEQNQSGKGSLQQKQDARLTLAKGKFCETVNIEYFVEDGVSGL